MTRYMIHYNFFSRRDSLVMLYNHPMIRHNGDTVYQITVPAGVIRTTTGERYSMHTELIINFQILQLNMVKSIVWGAANTKVCCTGISHLNSHDMFLILTQMEITSSGDIKYLTNFIYDF
jgi:hypothetical protein